MTSLSLGFYSIYIIIFTWQIALIISQHCLWALCNPFLCPNENMPCSEPPAPNHDLLIYLLYVDFYPRSSVLVALQHSGITNIHQAQQLDRQGRLYKVAQDFGISK